MGKLSMKYSILILAIILAANYSVAQENPQKETKTGIIKGVVLDSDTRTPLIGVTVMIKGTKRGAASDTEGNFRLNNIPVGSYALEFKCIGYSPLSKTDIMVRPGRITNVTAELNISPIKGEDLTVISGYFPEVQDQNVSTTNFSSEEIRRAPGSAGDVSRIMAALPSIAKVNDQLNSLIVRGGTPTENGFYVDNIEIPNINHYPLQGSSGGPIGLINVDFIEDVDFSAGGFSVVYGDRLSSIMDLKFREGNREEFDGQIDMNFAGLGVGLEGPMPDKKGSYLFSARRSYLDLLVGAIGTGVAPRYSDYQGKVTVDLSAKNKISALGIVGVDFIEFNKEDSEDQGNNIYGFYKGYEYTGGLNWQYFWNRNGYSNTSISFLGTRFESDLYETSTDVPLAEQISNEQIAQIRNVNYYRLNNTSSIDFGFDTKLFLSDYEISVVEYTNPVGDTLPPLNFFQDAQTPKFGGFLNYRFRPFEKLSLSLGARADYFDYNQKTHFSPRLSASYSFSPRTSLTAATGIYNQNLPLSLLAQRERNKNLNDPESYHFVLSLNHLLTENTKLSVETYYKYYREFPVDPSQPQFFVVDELVYRGFFGNYENLTSDGIAAAYGIEAYVQKKLVEGVYGLIGGSYYKSRYKGLDGIWRDRVFDNRLLFSVEGGYKPNRSWEFSTRWIYAGGPPFTPIDLAASRLINRTVLDGSRVNESRFPAYHSLNLRADKRWFFKGSNLIAYVSVWNAYNRKNVSQYYWNEIEQDQDVVYQWGLLPVMGIEYEF